MPMFLDSGLAASRRPGMTAKSFSVCSALTYLRSFPRMRELSFCSKAWAPASAGANGI